MRRLGRAFAFARRIPPAKMLRRLELAALRRAAQAWPPALNTDIAASARAPLPLFAPRAGQRRGAGGWTFSFLNQSCVLGAGPDWSGAPDIRSRQLWRMHLHYMEYLEGVGDAEFEALVGSWMLQNPPFTAPGWSAAWNTYAASIRAVVWMQQLAVRQGRLGADLAAAMRASVARHIGFIARFLETDLGGNHLIKNIKALIWASRFFAGPQAVRWEKQGLALLKRELGRQVLADGVHFERSASYHVQCFADLLEMRAALGADPLSGALDDALARMAQACADLAHPDGGPALFNDAGLTMAYAPAACLEAYARLFGAAPAPRAVFAMAEAGYFGARVGPFHVIADCGKIAPDELPAHGHGDMLSFELSYGGARFIVDPGVFEYVEGEKRAQSRASASHNTLAIEGADQADFYGAFRMGRRGAARVRAYAAHDAGFTLEGEHDGYAHLPGRPVHVRRFTAGADAIVIEDRLEGASALPASASLLLHPDARAEPREGGVVISRGDLKLALACSAPLGAAPAPWWPDLGVERPTTRLTARLDPPLRELCWRFTPCP